MKDSLTEYTDPDN